MDGAKIFTPNGTMVTLSKEMAGNETGYVVYRDIFDQELARQAAKAGVDEGFVSSMLVISTACSVLTVPLWLYFVL